VLHPNTARGFLFRGTFRFDSPLTVPASSPSSCPVPGTWHFPCPFYLSLRSDPHDIRLRRHSTSFFPFGFVVFFFLRGVATTSFPCFPLFSWLFVHERSIIHFTFPLTNSLSCVNLKSFSCRPPFILFWNMLTRIASHFRCGSICLFAYHPPPTHFF